VQDLDDLNPFVAVVTHGGFSAAARALDAPKSRLSLRVAGLENDLGVRLQERSTRRLKVTDVGQDVYRHAQAVMSEAEAIDEIVLQRKSEPQGLVRVSAPPGVDRVICRHLPRLLARHPKLRVQVIVSNARIDLIEERVDVAVRVREVLDTDGDLQLKVISRTAAVLVASPEILASHGAPDSVAALAAYPTVSLTDATGPDRWFVTLSVARRQFRANVISTNRQKWIETFRDRVSELLSLMNAAHIIKCHSLDSWCGGLGTVHDTLD
jgi:DNA-binding transcriptional LysR family regulator